MILQSDIAEKALALAATPDELLPGFTPLDRVFIIALKKYMQKEAAGGQRQQETRP